MAERRVSRRLKVDASDAVLLIHLLHPEIGGRASLRGCR